MIAVKNCDAHKRIVDHRAPSLFAVAELVFQLSQALVGVTPHGVVLRPLLLAFLLPDQLLRHLAPSPVNVPGQTGQRRQ